jgi:hypothetical protein
MSDERCPKCGHEWFDCECKDTRRPPVWDADAWVYPDGTTHRERQAAARLAAVSDTDQGRGEAVKPYYSDEHVTLYHGDCLEVDAWLATDVLCTDPPYGIGWVKGENRAAGSRRHLGILNDSDTSVRDAALRQWSGPAAVFGSFRAPRPEGVVQTLVWKKPVDAGVVGSTTGYRTDTELVYLIGKHGTRPPSRSSVLESRCGVSRYRTEHPHSKPVPILEQLIDWMPGVVADPFAGSGSTLIAARNLGRKSIGVEVEERYCELIASRLAQGCLDFGDAS